MTEYKKPGIVSALLLLTVLSVLSAAFGMIMLVSGGNGSGLPAPISAAIFFAGLSSAVMFAFMGAVVEYLAKIHHAMTSTKQA